MAIKNYTTSIDMYKSLGEIQGALASHGARKIKEIMADNLEDLFQEWVYEDQTVGLRGMSDGEKELANALLAALKGAKHGQDL